MTIKECRLLHIFFMFSLYFEICHKSDTQIYGPLKVFQEFFVKSKRTSKISEFTASFLQINCVSTFESCGFSLHNFFRKQCSSIRCCVHFRILFLQSGSHGVFGALQKSLIQGSSSPIQKHYKRFLYMQIINQISSEGNNY